MKKRSRLATLTLGLFALTTLSSCGGKSVASVAYFIENGTKFGDYVNRIDLTVTNGTISSASLEGTYGPCVWARVNPDEKSDAKIDTLDVSDGNLLDGTTGTIHFAKYISFGTGEDSIACTGALRDPEDSSQSQAYYRGDYVQYTITAIGGVVASDLKVTDLWSYLYNTEASNTYRLGSSIKKLYEATVSKDVHVYGHSLSDENTNNIEYTPYFPESGVKRSANALFSQWKTGGTAFCTFLVGNKLDYVDDVQYKGDDYYAVSTATDGTGTWLYNPYYGWGDYTNDAKHFSRIEGCTSFNFPRSTLRTSFIYANAAFAYVEYASKRG